MRAAWFAGWTVFALFAVAALAFGLTGALSASERILHAAAILAFSSMISGFAMAVMSFEGMPTKSLPRADRKRLAAEERRIRFDAEIRRLEREVGE